MSDEKHLPVEIRPVTAADADDWRRMWRAYLDFYETELPETVYDTTFARLLAPGPDGPFGLLAVADGRPVGLVHYIFHQHCWKPEGTVYLQDLYADPEVRGRGVGRALIEAVYAAADAAGRPSVYWLTQDFNHTARQLYDRIAVQTPFIRYVRK